ncbi:MAG: NepR family anti-sigma factor [Hasllibacter sp.]
MSTDDGSKSRTQVAAQIDENLKRVYSDVIEGDVPDRFKDLIAKLRAGESASERSE